MSVMWNGQPSVTAAVVKATYVSLGNANITFSSLSSERIFGCFLFG